ncbi:MAG: GTP-binding protein [Clostridiales bacterium]|jgi:GTP-binding protein|nr:GTP-binding protein [Clostridiales bacterium]
MKIKQSRFMISAVTKSQYPESDLPELAFAGRSNVGKSSLINMLLNRKGLAKTSSTPGKTQLVNFYDIDGLFRFVDLPGYGFAKVSKAQKASWGKIIETYLTQRENLLEVFQLVDIRHKPTGEDREMYDWIRSFGFRGIVFATKADKLSRSQCAAQVKVIRKTLEMPPEAPLVLLSSDNRSGKYDAWDLINRLFEEEGLEIFVERQSATAEK